VSTSEPSVPRETLLQAPEQIGINGRRYFIEAYLWRNLTPSNNLINFPLITLARLRATDSQPLPADLDLDRIWLIKGSQVWESNFTNEAGPEVPGELEKVARNGPTWGEGTPVSVVVRLVSKNTNKTYLLKAPNQPLIRNTY
jgi:hypothetical protein